MKYVKKIGWFLTAVFVLLQCLLYLLLYDNYEKNNEQLKDIKNHIIFMNKVSCNAQVKSPNDAFLSKGDYGEGRTDYVFIDKIFYDEKLHTCIKIIQTNNFLNGKPTTQSYEIYNNDGQLLGSCEQNLEECDRLNPILNESVSSLDGLLPSD